MMPHQDTDTEMDNVVQFPGAAPMTDVELAPPVVNGELWDDNNAAPRLPAPAAMAAVPAQLPLSPRHAGPLRYVGSVISHGTRRTPVVLWDRAWDVLKSSDLREGNTHRGRIADKHIAEHSRRVAGRRKAVATVVRVAAAPWTRWNVRIRKVPMPAVTWITTIGSVAAVAYPDSVLLFPFRLINSTISELVGTAGSIAWHTAGAAVEIAAPVIGPAALVVSVGYGIMAEHRRRQELCAQLGDPSSIIDTRQVNASEHADLLTEAFLAAGIIKAGQQVLLTGLPYQVPGGVCAPILLPEGGYTGQLRQADRLTKLASVLDTTPQHLSVVDGDTVRRCFLTVYKTLPFTGPAVAHPLLGGGRIDVLRDGVPAGLDINGGLVRVDVKRGRHGLIVASSGNGKSQHIMSLTLSLAQDPTSSFVLLDGKPDGALDPVRPLVERYVDALDQGYREAAAELLENEVSEMRDRQRRVRAGEQVGWRQIILDEFQMFTGNPAAGELAKGSPCLRIRSALVEISRLGRSVNVGLVLATQSYDGNTIDEAVLNNIGWRLVGFAPSKMSKEALGEHAERYDLDTSKMLVDEVQTGTAVMIAPNIDRYVLARGWYQDKDVVTAAVERLLELRSQTGSASPRRATFRAADAPPASSELPEVLAQLAKVIGGRTGLIPTQELAALLGYPDPADAGARRLGKELRKAKVPAPDKPKGRMGVYPNPVSLTDLDAVRAAIANHIEID
jgi:hypothetical protein